MLEVNKVAGSFHFGTGKSFQDANFQLHNLLAFQEDNYNVILSWYRDYFVWKVYFLGKISRVNNCPYCFAVLIRDRHYFNSLVPDTDNSQDQQIVFWSLLSWLDKSPWWVIASFFFCLAIKCLEMLKVSLLHWCHSNSNWIKLEYCFYMSFYC